MVRDLVYDVGVHNGNDTAHYLASKYRVIAIEANPVYAEQVRAKFPAEVASGQLTVLNVGITDTDGNLDFWVNEEVGEWSSFTRTVAGREGHRLTQLNIPTRRLDGIMKEFGVPYYLKIDIEGFDRFCIDALTPSDLPVYTSLESCDMATLVALRDLGYDTFKWIDQHDHQILMAEPAGGWKVASQYIRFRHSPNRAVRAMAAAVGKLGLGSYIRSFPVVPPKRFPEGSSGPFAEQTPGYWMSYVESVKTLDLLLRKCKEQGKRGLWVDVHARRSKAVSGP